MTITNREKATKASLQLAVANSFGQPTRGLSNFLKQEFLRSKVEVPEDADENIIRAARVELMCHKYGLESEKVMAIQDYLVSYNGIGKDLWIKLHEALELPMDELEGKVVKLKQKAGPRMPAVAKVVISGVKFIAANPEKSVAAVESITVDEWKNQKLTSAKGLGKFFTFLKKKADETNGDDNDLANEITALINTVADQPVNSHDEVRGWVLSHWSDFEDVCGQLDFSDDQTWINIQHNLLKKFPEAGSFQSAA